MSSLKLRAFPHAPHPGLRVVWLFIPPAAAPRDGQNGAAVFQELYEARASDDDTHPVGLAAIAGCATLDGPAQTEPLVWGWDLARYQSWTAGIGLDPDGQICRLVRFKPDWTRTIDRIVRETGAAIALVDATHGSVGDPILATLQQDGREGRFLPFQFTAHTREVLLDQLAVAIQRQAVRIPRDGQLRSELEALEWQATARQQPRVGFPEGMSGDLVMALALAIRQLKHSSTTIEIWGGEPIVVEDEPFEDTIRRHHGMWFPGD